MLNLSLTPVAGTVAALLAVTFSVSEAQAQTVPLYGGGSTLPEKVYRDIFNCYGNHSGIDTEAGLAGPPTTICDGATPYRSNVEVLYVGVDSGNGKKGFVNDDPSKFTDGPHTPDAVPVPSTTDFGPFFGTGVGAAWVPDTTDSGPFFQDTAYFRVHFAASEEPLTASDINTYNTNSDGWGAPIQLPALVTTVAIPFNRASGTWIEKGKDLSASGATSKVQFSTNTLCGVFTGAITDWSDPSITADNAGYVLGNGPITVVYRRDTSGTTFLFIDALINQCAISAHPVPAQWLADNGGVANNRFFTNVLVAGHLPGNFIDATGSADVKSKVNATAGSVSYLSPNFIREFDSSGPMAVNLQTWLSFSTGVAPDWVVAGPKSGTAIMSTFLAPSFATNSCPVGTDMGQASDGICAHNPLNWARTNPTPNSSNAYPIGGFSYIDLYTCYARQPYNQTNPEVDAMVSSVSTVPGTLGLWRWYFGSTTENGSLVKISLTANGFSLVPSSWISGARKLLTTDIKTKVSAPGTAKTGCSAVTGRGA